MATDRWSCAPGAGATVDPEDLEGNATSRRHVVARKQLDPSRQLEIEQTIARLSRHLLDLASGDIEAGVSHGLETAARLVDADRAYLLATQSQPPYLMARYEWTGEGFEGYAGQLEDDHVFRFRWSAERITSDDVLAIDRPADLPDEAKVERADLERRGVRSALAIRVRSGGSVGGLLCFECLRNQRHWDEREIGQLQLLAGMFAGVLRRKHAEDALARQLELETRIAHLSRRFIGTDHRGLDRVLHEGVEEARAIAGADLVYLIGIDARSGRISDTYASGTADLTRHAQRFSASDRELFRFAFGKVEAGEILDVPSLDALPDEAAAERSHLAARGVRALLGIPVQSGGRLVGYFGIEWHREERIRTDEEPRLRLLAEIFAGALQRKQMQAGLERQLDGEQRIAELSRVFLTATPDQMERQIRHALREAADIVGAERIILLDLTSTVVDGEGTYEWCAEGVASAPLQRSAWGADQVQFGAIVQVRSVNELPPEAVDVRADLESRGVRSAVGLPIRSTDHVAAYLGCETFEHAKTWTDEELTLLRLVGEMLASALRRKHAEQALRQSQAQLAQAQKMDAVGRLAGGIAHDFNNLLMVISGHSEGLLRDLDPDGASHEDAREISEAADRATSLTKQLLSFSRRQLVSPRRLVLNDVIRGVEGMLRRLLGEDIQLRTELDPDLGAVRGDPHQLEQILVNLAVNGRDAMPEGGQLLIRTRNVELELAEAQRIGLAGAGPHVLLSVDDSGVGMDAATSARVFEPFFTTKDPGKGTGLGLSIVYSVLQQCGGAVTVRSQPGAGSRFDLFVPRFDGQLEPAPRHEAVSATRGSGTILLVEDERPVRRLVRRELENVGYRVIEAADGVEAIDLARAHQGMIDMLVTDVVMPRMGGGRLAARLVRERPDLRVLYLSGYPDERGEGSGEDLPDGRFLQKPVHGKQLLDAVAALLAGADESA